MRTTVISLLLSIFWLVNAHADVAGQVTNISGPLFAVKNDGSKRVLTVSSPVEQGDTLVTGDKAYAKVKFADQAEVTMKPDSQMRVDAFKFDQKAPDKDNAVFGLLKGALRTITGLIGKRGNQNAYRLQTATATIGIRGTIFGATVCDGSSCGGLPDGTYVDVIEGKVLLASPPVTFGEQAPPIVLTAGQFGFVPTVGPPQQLPEDPGLNKGFTPPASFQQSPNSDGQQSSGGETSGQSDGDQGDTQEQKKKECVVR